MLTSADIRRQFIDFFATKHDHQFVPSSPVVPHDDPTLLFANAGMNQFKPCFLGTEKPEHTRIANTQKCIRAGGKHNDLDDVGKDTYHHTFFEMLGNWSIGDYFKKEAIDWAWELLVDVWGLDPERLHATYFQGAEADGLEPDNEARDLWLKHLPAERIHPGNAKDNFWEMGDTGPCGPCSEIHYDGTPVPGKESGQLVNAGDPRVIEIWNLVFIQFNRAPGSGGAPGKLTPLPAKHIDTGMGFERIVRILQGKDSNYDTDVWTPLFDAIRQITGAKPYGGAMDDPVDVAYRVIADHARCLTFALTDGATPGNEGRGYVLRRILRRGVRYGRQNMGQEEPFIHKLVPTIVDTMGQAFPELKKNPQAVVDLIQDEEESFAKTLDRGIELFDQAAEGRKQISAEDAFKLHDTYGFPLDLTQLMAEERGMTVDVEGFNERMESAREQSRTSGGGSDARQSLPDYAQKHDLSETKFKGYKELVVDGVHVIAKLALNGDAYEPVDKLIVGEAAAVVTDITPFYAEAGGQVGDTGYIRTHEGAVFRVNDTVKFANVYFHLGELETGSIHKDTPAFSSSDKVLMEVDTERRAKIMANHTATHMLNRALRNHVNPEADQRGSLVDDMKLRFDFSNSQAVGVEQMAEVQAQVNTDIDADMPVHAGVAPQDQALKINGLRAVFGEKYPPKVRVVSIGQPVEKLLKDPANEKWSQYSIEFCGGTHLKSTGEAERMVVVSEEAVAKGVRRITALTGKAARDAEATAAALLASLESVRKLPDERLAAAVADVQDQMAEVTIPMVDRAKLRAGLEELHKRIKQQQKKVAAESAGQVVDQARAIADEAEGEVVVASIDGADGQTIRQAMDVIRKKRPEAAMLLGSVSDGKVAFLAAVPQALIDRGLKAGDWVREVARVAGGGGGGKPDMAQAGGKDPSKLEEALDKARAFAADQLE